MSNNLAIKGQPNEIALVLGGSSGMGKETARLLLQSGIRVVVTGRDREKMKVAEQELSRAGEVETVVVDLYDADSVKSFIGRIDAEGRHIRYLD